MDFDEIAFRIGLGMTKGMTPAMVRALSERGVSPRDFFEMEMSEVNRALMLRQHQAFKDSVRKEALECGKREAEFVSRHNIRVYSLADEDYPWSLREIPDAPVTLYQLGSTDLNVRHAVSVVGTRKMTSYGMEFCKKFVTDLGGYFPDLCVVSGLAYGVDGTAHVAALDAGLTTVAVVAHGLDTIYPAAHRDMARRIVHSGGAILSEYPSGSTPYAGRFLERNRIVAGLTPLTVVVESEIKGGAMSTANYAFQYDREVMALPGRTTDRASGGCNLLIRKEKAHLLTAAADVVEMMGWRPADFKIEPQQRNLFPELEGVASRIYELLKFEADPMNVDAIYARTGIAVSELMASLTELEFDGIITRMPGNRYAVS